MRMTVDHRRSGSGDEGLTFDLTVSGANDERDGVPGVRVSDEGNCAASRSSLVGVLALPERVAKQDAALKDLLRHMDYMINLVGIEHLALSMNLVKYDDRALKDRHYPLHKPPLIKSFE